jgi:hypothetical protein
VTDRDLNLIKRLDSIGSENVHREER